MLDISRDDILVRLDNGQIRCLDPNQAKVLFYDDGQSVGLQVIRIKFEFCTDLNDPH